MNAVTPRGPLPASSWGRMKKPVCIYLRSRTPGPPPFLSMNTMPLASNGRGFFSPFRLARPILRPQIRAERSLVLKRLNVAPSRIGTSRVEHGLL
jgi:hypothetical protein